MSTDRAATARTACVVRLGCARNDVDSEELAGRLTADGWTLVADPKDADVAVVNTCGFIEQAKKDSIDTLLAAADLKEGGRTRAVVAVGCLAERYGQQLAAALPEADAVLGFDAYADISGELTRTLAGDRPAAHVPRDRRQLLPIAPARRQPAAAQGVLAPPEVVRRRLDHRAWAPLKLASGCDRRCAFCAIPSFRGAFVSRRPEEVLAEARWLAGTGVRELFLVSENSTSYGKDLGDRALLESLLAELATLEDITRVRLSYLQPAEVWPGLISAIAGTAKVAPYFDLSFQHASGPLLRRMRRFGDRTCFGRLLEQIRALAPEAGIRSNVIVGFPGETEDDVAELEAFLAQARLDVVGVFGYSDEEGTEAQTLPGHVDPDEIAARVERVTATAQELTAQRAEDRVGTMVQVLVDESDAEDPTGGDEPVLLGRAEFQGPDVDGVCLVRPGAGPAPRVGDLVRGVVVQSRGVDLVVEPG